jgi:hypothetical protein
MAQVSMCAEPCVNFASRESSMSQARIDPMLGYPASAVARQSPSCVLLSLGTAQRVTARRLEPVPAHVQAQGIARFDGKSGRRERSVDVGAADWAVSPVGATVTRDVHIYGASQQPVRSQYVCRALLRIIHWSSAVEGAVHGHMIERIEVGVLQAMGVED